MAARGTECDAGVEVTLLRDTGGGKHRAFGLREPSTLINNHSKGVLSIEFQEGLAEMASTLRKAGSVKENV